MPQQPFRRSADDDGDCTPGYWKNHDLAWAGNNTGYDPDDLAVAVWNVPAGLVDKSDTLLDALNYDGGGGPAGMARNLLRHAAAALLNANATGVEYLYTGATVIADTNSALASGQRPNMEQVKNRWNDANQAGSNGDPGRSSCPPGRPCGPADFLCLFGTESPFGRLVA